MANGVQYSCAQELVDKGLAPDLNAVDVNIRNFNKPDWSYYSKVKGGIPYLNFRPIIINGFIYLNVSTAKRLKKLSCEKVVSKRCSSSEYPNWFFLDPKEFGYWQKKFDKLRYKLEKQQVDEAIKNYSNNNAAFKLIKNLKGRYILRYKNQMYMGISKFHDAYNQQQLDKKAFVNNRKRLEVAIKQNKIPGLEILGILSAKDPLSLYLKYDKGSDSKVSLLNE